jgi:PhnB protein
MKNTPPQLSPYLNFNGNCKEAMESYQLVLGGKLELNTFGKFGNVPEEQKDKIMHAVLKNDTLTFMASDNAPGVEVKFGDNISMSIAGADEGLLTKFFNGLAEGGKIDMPLAKQIWGDTFGMLTDKFGIHWMININAGDEQTA